MRHTITPLAFGDEIAQEHRCAKEFGSLIESAFPGLEAYEALESKFFLSRTSKIDLGDAAIVSAAISPTHVQRKNNQTPIFMLPFAGQPDSYCEIRGDRVNWGMGLGGVFLPKTDYGTIGKGGFRTHLMWQLDENRLVKTAEAMLAVEHVDLELDRIRALPNHVAGKKTMDVFSSYLPILRLYQRDPSTLVALGVDDLFYRSSVALLVPQKFERSEAVTSDRMKLARHRIVRTLADQVVSSLESSYSLTELERLSGLSARSLQTGFLECFNMSPSAWIKEQRLQRARELLRHRTDLTVQVVARRTGFQSQATFFAAYRARFGETPKATSKADL